MSQAPNDEAYARLAGRFAEPLPEDRRQPLSTAPGEGCHRSCARDPSPKGRDYGLGVREPGPASPDAPDRCIDSRELIGSHFFARRRRKARKRAALNETRA